MSNLLAFAKYNIHLSLSGFVSFIKLSFTQKHKKVILSSVSQDLRQLKIGESVRGEVWVVLVKNLSKGWPSSMNFVFGFIARFVS